MPIAVALLFVLSAITLSGFVSAYGKHYRGPTGTCYFTKSSFPNPMPTYSVGETMYIHVDGSFGAAQKGTFEVVLKGPSGAVMYRFQQYPFETYPTGFSDTLSYTQYGPTGVWTVELDYLTWSKRKLTTTPIAINEALVVA